MEDREVLKSH